MLGSLQEFKVVLFWVIIGLAITQVFLIGLAMCLKPPVAPPMLRKLKNSKGILFWVIVALAISQVILICLDIWLTPPVAPRKPLY
jgi:hypothetical protein